MYYLVQCVGFFIEYQFNIKSGELQAVTHFLEHKQLIADFSTDQLIMMISEKNKDLSEEEKQKKQKQNIFINSVLGE